MPTHTPAKRRLNRSIKAIVGKAKMGAKLTASGRSTANSAKKLTEKAMMRGGRRK